MTCNQLSDQIRSWVWLYRNSPYPVSTDPIITNYTESAAQKWSREMMADAAKLEEPIELMWTPAGEDLQAAIDLARSGERSKLRDVYDLLLKIDHYIIDNNLYQKNIRRS